MWPFAGGLLASLQRDLFVPSGTYNGDAIYPSCPSSYARFNASNGDFETRNHFAAWVARNPSQAWIHEDMKDPDIFDSSLYEVRYISVSGYTSGLSGDTYYTNDPGDEVGWIDMDTHLYWKLSYCGDNDSQSVTGSMQIREKANPSNKKTGTVTLQCIQEGPS